MDHVRKLSDSINEEFAHFDKADEVPDSKLEDRFNRLALAFRTDRLTLDKRLGIQESSRDLAEQNVDTELHCLRDALQVLKPLCRQEEGQEVLLKMGHHLDVLEHSIARVSTRAEVLGAVQQEKRMCLAMEVMINYTENLRRLRDREMAQVDTARKMLDEKGAFPGRGQDSGVVGAKAFRRRSEIVLPRILGGGGVSSLQFFSGMHEGPPCWLDSSSLSRGHFCGAKPCVLDSAEEPKQRFQTATANITVQNLVASTLRHGSQERQKRMATHPPPSAPDLAEDRSRDREEKDSKQQVSSQEGTKKDGSDISACSTLKEDTTADTEVKDLQSHVSTIFSKPLLQQGREPMDVPQHDKSRPTPEKDSPTSSISSNSSLEKEDLQRWLPDYVTWRYFIAGVIFCFALVVFVVTFASSPNVTSQ